MSLLILYFTFFVHPLLCISVPFFSPASFFPLFFNSFAAPPNIWLLAFYHSIAPCLPHSRLLPKSFFRSLLLLIIFHSATPLSFFHLLCVKSYRVHSSGSLMPVPLCWLHWHKLIFSPSAAVPLTVTVPPLLCTFKQMNQIIGLIVPKFGGIGKHWIHPLHYVHAELTSHWFFL